ncbi:unnamed protein product [Adineta ricciae]|uniref:RRM domain-containing protein n=1 Tax=Adineta ricciae TaxID=249248 RepID=A0A814BFQ1_ADIRI|nr:unnamed protein product [Adineta ricciae]CAF0926934.1 unnamed protein product [Adineta ricciae]
MAFNSGMNTNDGNSGNMWSSGSRGGSHGGYSRSNDDDDSNGPRGGGSYGGSFGNNNSRRGGGSYGFRRQNNGGEMETLRDAIFIQNLPKDVTRDQIYDAFSKVGSIKTDDRSGGPKIWIYKDRDTGEGNGRATVTYDDEETADRAISEFNDQHIDSLGGSVRVQLAQRRTRTDNNDRGGRGGYRGGRSNWDSGSRPGFNSNNTGRWGNADGGSGGRGFSDNRRGGGGFRSRDGGDGDSFRDSDDRGGSYRGGRGGPYRGASRGNGGSSNYAPY